MFDENKIGLQIMPYDESVSKDEVICKIGNSWNIFSKNVLNIGIIANMLKGENIQFLQISDNSSNIKIKESILSPLLIALSKGVCSSNLKKVEIILNKFSVRCMSNLSVWLEDNNALTIFELKCNNFDSRFSEGLKSILTKTSLEKIVLNRHTALQHIVGYFSSTKYLNLTTLDLSCSFDHNSEEDLSTYAPKFTNILLNSMPNLKEFIYDGHKDIKQILLNNLRSVNYSDSYLKFRSILYPSLSPKHNQQDQEQQIIDLTVESSTIEPQSKCDINGTSFLPHFFDIFDKMTSYFFYKDIPPYPPPSYHSLFSNCNNVEASTSTSSNYMNTYGITTLDFSRYIPLCPILPYPEISSNRNNTDASTSTSSNCINILDVTSNISSKESDDVLLSGEDSSDRSLVIDEDRCE